VDALVTYPKSFVLRELIITQTELLESPSSEGDVDVGERNPDLGQSIDLSLANGRLGQLDIPGNVSTRLT
jgi:hypothetical protein